MAFEWEPGFEYAVVGCFEYNYVLCCQQHGAKLGSKERLIIQEAHRAKQIVRPPDFEYGLYDLERRIDGWACRFAMFDWANKWIEPFECGVAQCSSESSARAYVRNRFRGLKVLHDGQLEAFLHWCKTGVACLANWTPSPEFPTVGKVQLMTSRSVGKSLAKNRFEKSIDSLIGGNGCQ